MSAEFITVVSGLPRSGTSMMMQMLVAGGMPAVTDGLRSADADNPRGYFELEAVKKLKTDSGWLARARGRAVKVISMLLYELPAEYEYRVIFMQRDMGEILASQNEMLKRRGTAGSDAGDEAMRRHLESHLAKVGAWLAGRRNFRVLHCRHRDLLCASMGEARRVGEFLGSGLDVQAMVRAIDPTLHRNRAGDADIA